jgi:hypothetical protein
MRLTKDDLADERAALAHANSAMVVAKGPFECSLSEPWRQEHRTESSRGKRRYLFSAPQNAARGLERLSISFINRIVQLTKSGFHIPPFRFRMSPVVLTTK